MDIRGFCIIEVGGEPIKVQRRPSLIYQAGAAEVVDAEPEMMQQLLLAGS